jgi:hypothetical protein
VSQATHLPKTSVGCYRQVSLFNFILHYEAYHKYDLNNFNVSRGPLERESVRKFLLHIAQTSVLCSIQLTLKL